MKEQGQKPIVQRIHEKFDTFPRTTYGETHGIDSVDITSNQDSYTITAYPRVAGGYFDGLVLNVQAQDGIFGESMPQRVEASRNFHGTFAFMVESLPDEKGDVQLGQKPLISAESLILPGDDGFEMFEELHEKLKNVQGVLKEQVSALHPPQEVDAFQYKDATISSVRVDRENQQQIFHGKAKYTVRSFNGGMVDIFLEAETPVPYEVEDGYIRSKRPEKVRYTEGKAFIFLGKRFGDGLRAKRLEDDDLQAMNEIRNSVKELYNSERE